MFFLQTEYLKTVPLSLSNKGVCDVGEPVLTRAATVGPWNGQQDRSGNNFDF